MQPPLIHLSPQGFLGIIYETAWLKDFCQTAYGAVYNTEVIRYEYFQCEFETAYRERHQKPHP